MRGPAAGTLAEARVFGDDRVAGAVAGRHAGPARQQGSLTLCFFRSMQSSTDGLGLPSIGAEVPSLLCACMMSWKTQSAPQVPKGAAREGVAPSHAAGA